MQRRRPQTAAEAGSVAADGDAHGKRLRAGVPLRESVKPVIGAVLVVLVIVGVASVFGSDDAAPGAELASMPYARPSGSIDRRYRASVFERDPPARTMCAPHTAELRAALAALGGTVDAWMAPHTNHTRGIHLRCFSSAAEPAPGDTACERDILGLPWPLLSPAAVTAARGRDPPSLAARADEPTEDPTRPRAQTPSPAPRLPYAYTSLPDYLGSREHVERHRFWRTVGRAGLAELERPKLFIDVGPNGGFHSLVAGLYGFDVLALEPIPAAAAAMREALCLNGFINARITVANFTAGAAEGSCDLPSGSGEADHTCYSTLSLPPRLLQSSPGQPLRIHHRPLDSLHLPFVTVVKIDAGHRSIAVLLGMREILSRGGVEDPSAVGGDKDAVADQRPAEGDPLQRYAVTVVLVRVPLSLVRECVDILLDHGLAVFSRDIDKGALDTDAAIADALAKARAGGAAATGMHLFARPRERVDVLDHTAALRASARAAAAARDGR